MHQTINLRDENEILARVHKHRNGGEDFFGFRQEVLLSYLSTEALKGFAEPGADLSDWKPQPLHAEPIAAEVRDYMAFAWGKVQDHRSISASRSVEKIDEWLWVLGLDALRAQMADAAYAQYGAPQLAVVCRALGLPIPGDERTARMIQSLRCEAGCEEGCGT